MTGSRISWCAIQVFWATWLLAGPLWATPPNVISPVVVAQSGQQAPGAPTGALFTRFSEPVINNSGQIAVGAMIQENGSSEPARTGIWSDSSGQLALVALDGAHPPEVDFAPDGSMNFVFNDAGETVFHGPGIWIDRGGSLEAIVVPGVPVMVDGHSETFRQVGRPIVNPHGVVAFAANDGITTGLYAGANGQFRFIADSRTHLPGPKYISSINLNVPAAINSAGQFAFFGASGSFFGSVWTDVRGSLELAAGVYHGSGFVGEFEFREVRAPTITEPGDVLFYGVLTGDGVTNENDVAIMKYDAGGLSTFVREGDPAPGLPEGTEFAGFLEPGSSLRVLSNPSGTLAFSAFLRGPEIVPDNAQSIWRVQNEELKLAVQTGTQAPGAQPGVSLYYLLDTQLNQRGQLALLAMLSGPDVYSTNDLGIWAEDADGKLQLIVREGDFIDMSGGAGTDVRQIIDLAGGLFMPSNHRFRAERDQPYAFNDRGQVAFHVVFHDFSQAILISNALVIPEPLTATLVWLGAAWLVSISRRYF
jgi:hypothetical protein